MSTEKFFQLVTIPDYRFSSDKEQCQNIDFDKIATDCDTKTISILQAINHIGVREGANKQVISSQADSLIKISRIWADFFPANTSNQPI
ncbi:hypothetical protein [Klebsiella pneumoniae]|uniref:hypothetical protein n=1 Tax=Klebsiella pneumoniae TaxID=573 RepID=UPI0006721411|nr:hypothetical protein [Klebsiella pneumoniae]KMX69733.1 hypothetical protein SL20_05082 [Klebsiella pneumoniae]